MNPFSLIIGVGASLGLLRIIQYLPANNMLRWLFAGVITLVGALVGARLGFVAAYDSYFKFFPQEIVQINRGGLSWPGAAIGAGLFALLALKCFRLPLWAGLDRLSRMILPVSAAIWLAGWQAGIAYGKPVSTATWWTLNFTDSSGLTTTRVPLQPAALLSLILLFILVEWLIKKTNRPGHHFALIAGVFSLHSLVFSLYRADPVQQILGLRLDTWASLVFCGSSIVILAMLIHQKKSTGTPAVGKMENKNENESGSGTN